MKHGWLWVGIAFALSIGGYLLAEWLYAGAFGPPLDDGWIYMAFARSLANGEGITYPGYDGPVASVTGPIWCALMALYFKLFGPGVFAAKLLGISAGIFGLFGAWRLGSAATRDPRTGFALALIVALSARFLWGTLSIMEVPFFVGAVSLGLAMHIERRRDSALAWWPALVVLWLAGWARPECFVFVVIATLDRRRWSAIAIAGVLLALYPAYHLWAYGHPLPTTFYAKAGSDTPLAIFGHGLRSGQGFPTAFGNAASSLASNLGLQLAAFTAYLPSWLPLLVPGFLLGLIRGRREGNAVPFVALCMLLFILARGALGFAVPWFQNGRYFVHVWPLFALVCLHGFDLKRTDAKLPLLILAAIGVAFALAPKVGLVLCWDWFVPPLEFAADDPRLRTALVWVPMSMALTFAILGYFLARRQGTLPRPPLWAFALYLAPALTLGAMRHGRGVEDTYALNVVMAKQVHDIVPQNQLVACHDIGALGYFANRPLLDLAGLGSPEIALRPRAPGQPRDIPAILLEYRPEWLCLTLDMMDMINPSAQPIPIAGIEMKAVVQHESNVTVAGSDYRLVRVEWLPR